MQKYIGNDYKSKSKKGSLEAEIRFDVELSKAKQNQAIYVRRKATPTYEKVPDMFSFNFGDPSRTLEEKVE